MITEEFLAPAAVVELTGVSLDTLRYYEKEGLVGPIERRSGQRRYTEHDVSWIGTVTCLRTAGLGIADLRRFTQLLRSSAQDEERVAFLRNRRGELLERLEQTRAAIEVLDHKIEHYTPEGADDSLKP
jgi:DNA-binding transcriptional MerR regulator